MTVGKLCNRDVIIAKAETPLPEAAALMKNYHVGDLVVVETRPGGQHIPVGILTDRDIALALASHATHLQYLRVGDLMRRNLVTAREPDSLHSVPTRLVPLRC